MKKNYIFYILILIACFGFSFQNANAQYRIVEVDPSADTVTIKNFGSTTQDIGDYRLCSLFGYRTLSSQTTLVNGSFNLAPNAEFTVSIPNYLNDSAADLGLYLPTGGFGTAANMLDFTQWGSGGNGRENVAVSKGIWTAGTFINVAPPYEFVGGASDIGVTFWDTLLNVDNFEEVTKFNISPNPASLNLNLTIPGSVENAVLKVYDMLGKKIIDRKLSGLQSMSIDVSNWNTGVYIVRVSSDDITQTKRFIKQ
ncbi:T9SS type A sorting domain-containing protein [Psychroserpens sp. Hel_I_66]|uniref:T9SS type A sorting domain-containing protein n=1 Tax=Psychroserpens sp. Hel_I_66 TaxID=1250004 RepID=UPI0006470FD5|nr:T9SS type A sorting domain-containing protein [Psychroserpens sp. Hel_I_66]